MSEFVSFCISLCLSLSIGTWRFVPRPLNRSWRLTCNPLLQGTFLLYQIVDQQVCLALTRARVSGKGGSHCIVGPNSHSQPHSLQQIIIFPLSVNLQPSPAPASSQSSQGFSVFTHLLKHLTYNHLLQEPFISNRTIFYSWYIFGTRERNTCE